MAEDNFPEPEQQMMPRGKTKAPAHSNHGEHDKMLHRMMPEKSDECGEK